MLDSAGRETIDRLTSIVATIARSHEVQRAFAPTDHLVDGGLTSMAMVDLMLAIESEFDLTIPQSEMQPTNFESIASLARMLGRLHAA